MEFSRGQIVKSCAGHDKDTFLVVLKVEGKYAYISDGKSRKLENPKKKSLKHLKPTNTHIDLADCTNRKLRNVLNSKLSELTVTN